MGLERDGIPVGVGGGWRVEMEYIMTGNLVLILLSDRNRLESQLLDQSLNFGTENITFENCIRLICGKGDAEF